MFNIYIYITVYIYIYILQYIYYILYYSIYITVISFFSKHKILNEIKYGIQKLSTVLL